MKKLLLISAFLLGGLYCIAQDNVKSENTTYFLIRHAEKVLSQDPNPPLNQWGIVRASRWAELFSDVDLNSIYSTDYIRTINTVKPLADIKNLEIEIYNPSRINYEEFLKKTKGQKILIVGHSNTIPMFVNSLIGIKKYEQIEDNNNGNLYIVTISGDTITDLLLHMN